MDEFKDEPLPGRHEAGRTSEEYRAAHGILLNYAGGSVTDMVIGANDVLNGARGLGPALDTVIRVAGIKTPGNDGNPDSYTVKNTYMDEPLPPNPPKKAGIFLAQSDGVVVSLCEFPYRKTDENKLPSESTFVTFPVDPSRADDNTPSIKLGDSPKPDTKYLLREPEDGVVAQGYAAALSGLVDRLVRIVPPPLAQPRPRHTRT